jgi:hypothetical protein
VPAIELNQDEAAVWRRQAAHRTMAPGRRPGIRATQKLFKIAKLRVLFQQP